MQEVEKVKEVERTEREKIKEALRLKKEKEKVGEFEKATVECPECGSHTLVHDYERAELICSECGLVVDSDFVDQGPEWRAFDHDQRMK
ncbi:MAG TPA: transcription initiation factor IIB, partial [Candidatus Methanoperedenaceae archaeon]|nr:transcription initiation factor IIB [Candidatus Methanoperedenaceae archaeon]